MAKALRGTGDETTIKYKDATLAFTGRFDPAKHFDVRLTTILINDDIVIAANPGELFAELGLEWKAKMRAETANPFYFGYTWNAGQWPGYVPSIKGAALGGFGADQDRGMIEVGAGEAMFNKHLETTSGSPASCAPSRGRPDSNEAQDGSSPRFPRRRAVRQTHQWRDAPGRRSRRLRRTEFKALAVFIAALFVCAERCGGRTVSQGGLSGINRRGGTRIAVTYTLWIPDGITTFRGIIVHQHGADMTASRGRLHCRLRPALGRPGGKVDCALLGPSYDVLNDGDLGAAGSDYWFDPRLGSDKTFLRAIGDFANQTGHPELSAVPWALRGHSAGAGWADVMSSLHPERDRDLLPLRLGVRLGRQTGHVPAGHNPRSTHAIPRICTTGVKEKGLTRILLATFGLYRTNGAPTGFAQDPRTGHECGDSLFRHSVPQRLPGRCGCRTRAATIKP